MFGPFERAVAGRFREARGGGGVGGGVALYFVLGVGGGVGTLIIVMSVMNGFKADLLGRILGLNGDLSVYGISRTISDYDALAGRIRKVPGVESANPLIEAQVLLNSGGYNAGGLVRGMTQADLQGLKEISGSLVAGSLDEFGSDDTIVVGTTLAERAGLSFGARLPLVSPNRAATA
ncbi:MAG: ABC transporter permease, partial [Novacetimonas hansenii]|uniref:ABC transporter permease n=1 Tax=Novacetimonas hansenii TaxID=436 RepID=UPI0039EB8323